MDQAIQDLMWISKRLKGVLELGPELQNISSLKQMADEHANRVREDKATLNTLSNQKDSLTKELEVLQATIEKDKAEASAETKDILKKARASADEVLTQAHDKATEISKDWDKKLEEFNNSIKDNQETEKALEASISNLRSKQKNIEVQLDALRQRI